MAAVGEDHVFSIPKKEVNGPNDLEKWINSDAYQEYTGFLEALNEAVRGKPVSAPVDPSPVIASILKLLENIDKLVDETAIIDQPQRFGNKAFAGFYEKLKHNASSMLTEVLPEKFHRAVPEISMYLIESVGNSTRIDYGTGHELSFIMFLYGLFRTGALDCNKKDDKIAAVTKIFSRYLILVRKLQVKFRMEPAGSHGVWSLDDFQFVPFIWGSSQLVANPRLEPSEFTDPEKVERLASEYIFLSSIQYILEVKSGPFHEHSNQLWNISGTQSWSKINQGLIKMYKGEVLSKFPVVQHMLFGSLLSISPFDSSKKAPRGRFPNFGLPRSQPPLYNASPDSNSNPEGSKSTPPVSPSTEIDNAKHT